MIIEYLNKKAIKLKLINEFILDSRPFISSYHINNEYIDCYILQYVGNSNSICLRKIIDYNQCINYFLFNNLDAINLLYLNNIPIYYLDLIKKYELYNK